MARVVVETAGAVELLHFEAVSYTEHAELTRLLRRSLLDDLLEDGKAASSMEELVQGKLLRDLHSEPGYKAHQFEVVYWPQHRKCLAFLDLQRGHGASIQDCPWLDSLAVSTALHGRKLGSCLIQRMLLRVGDTYVRLQASPMDWHPTKSDASALYRRFGFLPIPSSGGEMLRVPPVQALTDPSVQARLLKLVKMSKALPARRDEILQQYYAAWQTVLSASWTFPSAVELSSCFAFAAHGTS
jgi:hypothetical protein